MKAILEFNLPEDRDDFVVATKARNYKEALGDIHAYMRQLDKYSDKEVVNISELRDKLLDLENDCLEDTY